MVNNRIEKNIHTCSLLNFKVCTVTTQQTLRTRVLDMVTVPQAQKNSLHSMEPRGSFTGFIKAGHLPIS